MSRIPSFASDASDASGWEDMGDGVEYVMEDPYTDALLVAAQPDLGTATPTRTETEPRVAAETEKLQYDELQQPATKTSSQPVGAASSEGESDPVSPSPSTREDKEKGDGQSRGGDEGKVRDAAKSGGRQAGEAYPEKNRFDILLGMLTIATMVDPEGVATSNWASSGAGLRLKQEDGVGRTGKSLKNV